MRRFRRLWSSIVVKVTSLTVAGLALMFVGVIILMQTPVLTRLLYPKTLSDSADSVAELVWLLESSPEAIEPFILSVYEGGFRTAEISDDFAAGLRLDADMQASLVEGQSDVASRLGGRDVRFETLGIFKLRERLRQQGKSPMRVASVLQVAIKLRDGRVLNVWLAPAMSLGGQPAALITLGLVILHLAIALGFAIAAVTLRPIRRLERDAARVELGEAGVAISETGPAELRRVSAALNRMRERLAGLIREREQMVPPSPMMCAPGSRGSACAWTRAGRCRPTRWKAILPRWKRLLPTCSPMRAQTALRVRRSSSAWTDLLVRSRRAGPRRPGSACRRRRIS